MHHNTCNYPSFFCMLAVKICMTVKRCLRVSRYLLRHPALHYWSILYLMPLIAQSFSKFSSVFKNFNVNRRLLPCSLTPQFVLFMPTQSRPHLCNSANISCLCISHFCIDDKILPNVFQPPLQFLSVLHAIAAVRWIECKFLISLPDMTVFDLYWFSSTLCLFHLTSLEHFGMAIKKWEINKKNPPAYSWTRSSKQKVMDWLSLFVRMFSA